MILYLINGTFVISTLEHRETAPREAEIKTLSF